MAKLAPALKKVLKHEGGYVNDPDDRGGETIFGIARRSNPKWEGWKILDQLKLEEKSTINIERYFKANYMHLVEARYKNNYWNKIKGDKIQSQIVAEQVFDMAVNHGPKKAAKDLQFLLKTDFWRDIFVDGAIGPKTLEALHQITRDNFLEIRLNNVLVRERCAFYWEIATKNPSQMKYIKGWHNRALSFIKK